MDTIAFAGLDGIGKSTTASYLTQHLSEEYRLRGWILPFAYALRQELQNRLCSRTSVINFWEKPTPPWMRALLIGWGAYRRSQDPDYWVKAWERTLREQERYSANRVVLVDDVRYANEVLAVQRRGGLVFWLGDPPPAALTVPYELSAVYELVNHRIGLTPQGWADTQAAIAVVDEALKQAVC